jgi:methionyl-tRNA formyltransferase
MTAYLVAATRDWNIRAFARHARRLPGGWRLISRQEDLRIEAIETEQPRYLFFPHWSWRVPVEILNRVECVGFHMTDVPYGRGGSPLQNLIARGHTTTLLSALRMVDELDAGPVYLKRPLSLEGSAQKIFERAADLIYDMIGEIVATQPEPEPQKGEVVVFQRRNPKQSVLPGEGTLEQLYGHIRMLDAETYPRAFLDHGAFHLEFRDAVLEDGRVEARVRIRRMGEGATDDGTA